MKPVLQLILLTLAAFLGSLFASPEAEAVGWKTAPGDFFCGTLEDAGENDPSAREQCRINGWLNYDTASGCIVAARTTTPRNAARFEIETTQGVTNRRGHTSQRGDVRSRTDFENGQQVRRVDFDHSHGPLGPGHVHPVHTNPANPSQINTSRPRAPEPGEYLSPVLSDPRIQGGVYRP